MLVFALLVLPQLCAATHDSLRVWMETGAGTLAGNYGSVMAQGVLDGKAFYGMVSMDQMTPTTSQFLCEQAGYAGFLSFGKHSYADDEVKITKSYGESVGFSLDNLDCPPGAGSLSQCSVVVGEDDEDFYAYYWRGMVLECSESPVDCSADYADSSLSVSLQTGQGVENGNIGSIVLTGHFGPHDISGMTGDYELSQDTTDFLCRAAGYTTGEFTYGWNPQSTRPRLDENYGDKIGFGIDELSFPFPIYRNPGCKYELLEKILSIAGQQGSKYV